MKKVMIPLLLGVTVFSSVSLINKNSDLVNLKSELNHQKKENLQLTEKIQEKTDYIVELNQKNKKLSKRVVNEMNHIITLTKSTKLLDHNLKQELIEKEKIVKNLSSKICEDTPQEKEITDVYLLQVSELETTLLRKKVNKTFTKTSNIKKIDAIKANFQIKGDDFTPAGNKKVKVKLIDNNNETINYSKETEVNYKNENIDVVSIVEVDRKKINAGNYKLIVSVNGEEIESSEISIN